MKKFITGFILFVILIFIIGTLLIYAASNIRYSGRFSVLSQITGNPVKKYEGTFMKFYEAEHLTKPVDILVIGSSRAYRAFDPAVFEENNLNIHILASSSQTPLNTYYLLKKYLDIVKPRMVILDVHLSLLNNNGIECLYDLCVNTPISPELFQMAAAVDQPGAYTTCYAALINQLDTPIYRGYQFKPPKTYYKGFIGDTKSDSTISISKEDTGVYRRPLNGQELVNLDYIDKIIREIQSRNIQAVLIRQPVFGAENLQAQKDIIQIAKKYNAWFFNLNKFRNRLNPKKDLFDKNHLNASGAKIISLQTINMLRNKGFKF